MPCPYVEAHEGCDEMSKMMGTWVKKLRWVDGFVERIRPYVHVRLTDNVLIRMPNEAFKLNSTGAKALSYLLAGGKIKDILEARYEDESAGHELESFFFDLSMLLGSGVCDEYQSQSLDRESFQLGYIELPVLSEVALTWRCNIKCLFCYASCRDIGEEEEDPELQELDTAQFMRVLDIIRHDAEAPSVSFTGGEPTLRSDLADLIEYASKRLGMRVNLITNGTRISVRSAKRLKKAGLASAQVSIESPDAEIHDDIVGVDGAFQASVNGLLALKKAGITVHPHATLCSKNRASLSGMPRLVKSLGFDRFSMNLVIPAGRGIDPDLAVKYHEVPSILGEILTSARTAGVRFMWYSPTPICLFNPVAHGLGNKGCSACEGLLSIDPYGRLLPCSSWREPVGSLLNEGFEELWWGPKARALRDKSFAHPECRHCVHFALCHGACPLYFRAHGYEELAPALAGIGSHAKRVGMMSC